jgi:hypothetical protein
MSAPAREPDAAVSRPSIALAWFVALACGPGVESTADSGTHGTSAAASTSSGADDFSEACDLGPGWLADAMLRARCSDWLERHCAERGTSDCSETFITTDQHQLSCFVAHVVVADGGSCGAPQARCLPGHETDIYRCNSCGAEDKNLESRELAGGTREIVVMDDDQCGTKVFVADHAQCSAEDTACACGCGS